MTTSSRLLKQGDIGIQNQQRLLGTGGAPIPDHHLQFFNLLVLQLDKYCEFIRCSSMLRSGEKAMAISSTIPHISYDRLTTATARQLIDPMAIGHLWESGLCEAGRKIPEASVDKSIQFMFRHLVTNVLSNPLSLYLRILDLKRPLGSHTRVYYFTYVSCGCVDGKLAVNVNCFNLNKKGLFGVEASPLGSPLLFTRHAVERIFIREHMQEYRQSVPRFMILLKWVLTGAAFFMAGQDEKVDIIPSRFGHFPVVWGDKGPVITTFIHSDLYHDSQADIDGQNKSATNEFMEWIVAGKAVQRHGTSTMFDGRTYQIVRAQDFTPGYDCLSVQPGTLVKVQSA